MYLLAPVIVRFVPVPPIELLATSKVALFEIVIVPIIDDGAEETVLVPDVENIKFL